MTQRHAPRRVLSAFVALTAVGALLGAGSIVGQAAAGAPGPSTAVDVPWTGNGASDGSCDDVFLPGTDEKLTPAEGERGWLFILTSPFDMSAGSTLTFEFSDGTTGTAVGIPRPNGNGAFQFIVYTDADALLQSASATNGTKQSVLTVSHCQDGDTEEELPVVDVTKTAGVQYDETYDWTVDKSFVDGGASSTPGKAEVDYEVVATRTGPTPVPGSYHVAGTITVTNSGSIAVVVTTVEDLPSWVDADCTVDTEGLLPMTLDETTPSYTFDYECVPGDIPQETDLTNTGRATITWGDANEASVPSDPVPVDFENAEVDETFKADATLDDDKWLIDPITLTAADLDENGQYTTAYSLLVDILPPPACTFTNTASVTSDGELEDDDQVTVRVCSTVGGLTIGYWANKGLAQSWASWPGIQSGYAKVYGGTKAWAPTSAKALGDKILKASCAGDCLEMLRAQLFGTIMNAGTITGYADQCVSLPAILAAQTGLDEMTVSQALVYIKTNYSSSWTDAQRVAWKTFFDNLNQHTGGELQCITEV